MLIVGLTGGIATGKSTVSKRLKEKYELPVVDADLIARQVVEPGKPAYNAIVKYFKPLVPDLLYEDGTLNRASLGRAIFGNEKHRKVLNSIVHPAVRKAMVWQVLKAWLSGYAMVILDVPLLFESKLDMFCGTTLVISCDDETQLERLLLRDTELTRKDAQERMASQMPMAEKEKHAQYVIKNDGSLQDLYNELDKVLQQIRPSSITTLLEWIPTVGLGVAAYRFYTKSRL